MKKILTNFSKKSRVIRKTQRVGVQRAASAANLRKASLKTDAIRDAHKRLQAKRDALVKAGHSNVPYSKVLEVNKAGKIINIDKLSPEQLHIEEVMMDKAMEGAVESLDKKSAAALKKANETSDAFTMTDAQRKDFKVKSGAGRIAATGGVLLGLIDPATRAHKNTLKLEHKFDMERDKQLFDYLFGPSKEGEN